MSRISEIKKWACECGLKEEALNQFLTSSVSICQLIAEYAHKSQKRVNGCDYVEHPLNMLHSFRKMVDINNVNIDKLYSHNVPFDGVQEVILLHDVVEDTDFTMDDIKDIFEEIGLIRHYNLYIEQPLFLITHIKSESYEKYIDKVLTDPVASLVKMIDMNDNLDICGLDKLEAWNLYRCTKYLGFINIINEKYKFIENIHEYRSSII